MKEQLARQWQLLRILERHRNGLCLDELAEKTERSRRTIERDLKTFSEIGFPISCCSRDNGKKYWSLESHCLDRGELLLNPTEIIGLYLAQKILEPIKQTPFVKGLQDFWSRLTTLLPQQALNYFHDIHENILVKNITETVLSDNNDLEIIKDAIETKRIIILDYQANNKTQFKTSEIHPYGLVFHENSFYVIGFSVSADAIRTYKLQRIKRVQSTKRTFRKPKDFSLDKYTKGSFGIITNTENTTTIRCEFSDWAARLVRDKKWHSTQVIERDDGNRVQVSFLLNSTMEFKNWIMSFGHLAQVLEPAEVRNSIVDALHKTIELYKRK